MMDQSMWDAPLIYKKDLIDIKREVLFLQNIEDLLNLFVQLILKISIWHLPLKNI